MSRRTDRAATSSRGAGELARLRWAGVSGSEAGGTERRGVEPARCGVPWAPGDLPQGAGLALTDASGRSQPLQQRVVERWPDGSARWTLLDWLGAPDAAYTLRSEVRNDPGEPWNAIYRPLVVRRSADSIVLDTGSARFEVSSAGPFPFVSASIDDEPALDPERCGLFAVDEVGNRHRFVPTAVDVVEQGSLRATLRWSGRLECELADPLVDVVVEAVFHAGFPGLSWQVTVTNPRRAGHPGGRWSLGRAGAVFLRDLSLVMALPRSGRAWSEASPTIRCSLEAGGEMDRHSLPFEVYQDSSGGERWRSSNHVNRDGKVPHSFRGYRVRSGDQRAEGLRAAPVVELRRGTGTIGLACEAFWENFPKAVEVDRSRVVMHLFPSRSADVHELQGGERKTHRVRMVLQADEIDADLVSWLRRPLVACADPSWYAKGAAIPWLLPQTEDPNHDCQALVDEALGERDGFVAKREVIDEYGWRHFGELYGDHEAVRGGRDEPLVSHYNNQYDAVGGFAAQFLRSGDLRWYRLMDELALHVTDIDVYHTAYDKSAYNGGLFWHTVHYIDAGRATHRSYPAGEGVGGGPSSGHLYTTGLMLHYFLTGSTASRDTVIGLGQYVIDADDGTKTVFRFLDRGRTGHVSLSAFDGYHGPGRSAANSLNALIDAHRLSGAKRFMDKAEELLLRCVHPEDDLAGRRLDYIEGRWFYTMFLAALGRYLDYKVTLGENDRMYAYAQASLLRYADWAAENEYPYLDKPEVLEFPTETWAAQDMRKSEVFRVAARHAEGERRRLYQEKARYFFDVSVEQLKRFDTRTLCRPLVLVQALGYGQAYSERFADERAPAPRVGWQELGPPRDFVPQKTRAKRRFVWLCAAGLVGVTGLAILNWLLSAPRPRAISPLRSGVTARDAAIAGSSAPCCSSPWSCAWVRSSTTCRSPTTGTSSI